MRGFFIFVSYTCGDFLCGDFLCGDFIFAGFFMRGFYFCTVGICNTHPTMNVASSMVMTTVDTVDHMRFMFLCDRIIDTDEDGRALRRFMYDHAHADTDLDRVFMSDADRQRFMLEVNRALTDTEERDSFVCTFDSIVLTEAQRDELRWQIDEARTIVASAVRARLQSQIIILERIQSSDARIPVALVHLKRTINTLSDSSSSSSSESKLTSETKTPTTKRRRNQSLQSLAVAAAASPPSPPL